MALDVVILAAGKGTRMKSSLPKVLHKLAGKPMVEHIIESALALDAQTVNVVYGHGAQLLQDALSAHDVNWCLQSQQLGTGHAVKQALPYLNDAHDVLIVVGDAPLISTQTLQRLIDTRKHADFALLTVHLDDPTGMGRIVRGNSGRQGGNGGDNITAIVEHKDATDEQLNITEINTGMMLMSVVDLKRWLSQLTNQNAQGEYYLTDVIAMAAGEGKTIKAAHPVWAREVEGVNNRVQLASLERAYQMRHAEQLMTQGASIADPSRIDVRGQLSIGEDVSIDVNCVFEGEVSLGNNVSIGPNCVLKDCAIGDDTTIEPFSMIVQAQVGPACTVGPYARLRPGTDMRAGAKVGNFCEIKKAVIGEGSKVNHLTYIGDAQIGKGVNIGAGTITCNYDGVNKFQTVIEDNVFVGSNSSLVAPVNIGAGATVGAGSTITKDISAEDLSVARAKQRNISGWQKPTKPA